MVKYSQGISYFYCANLVYFMKYIQKLKSTVIVPAKRYEENYNTGIEPNNLQTYPNFPVDAILL